MKKVLRIVLIVVGVLVVLAAGGAIYLSASGLPTYDVKNVDLKVDVTPERIANGKRLAYMMCNHCHLNSTTRTLSGKPMDDLPPEFGVVHSKNITSDPVYGIGGWTDGQLYYFLRTGINPKRDGVYVPPWMPKYVHIANEDLYDIIAFLRSDEPELTATQVENGEVEPSLLVKFLARVAFKPMPYPEKPIPRPDTTDMKAFGEYLANGMFGCFECHAEDFKSLDDMEPAKSPGFYGGGNQLMDMTGMPIFSKNITPDKKHGVGAWTDDELRTAIRDGYSRDGKALRFPMLRARFLTDRELDAIIAYIRSVPSLPTQNKPKPAYEIAANASAGEKLYYSYGCASCHGKDGIGYGDLTKAHAKYPADSMLVDVINQPTKYWPWTMMPVWEGHIPDGDMQMLVAHVRELGKKSQPQAAM